MRFPAGPLFTMKDIQPDHLISMLEELPIEEWREEDGKYTTYLNLTKVHQPCYRDIPGYYTVVLNKEKKPIPLRYGDFIATYLANYTLKVFKEGHEVFSVYRLGAMRVYKNITNKMHPED